MREHHLSERHACRLVELSRDSYRHPQKADQATLDLHEKIMEIAHVCRRAGSATGCAPAAAHHTQALPDRRYIADDLLTLKLAVLGGGGMCWLPDYMCEEELRNDRLVRMLPDWSTPVGVVHAVFPSRRGMSPTVRSFLDFLGEYVPVCGNLQRRAA